MIEIITRQSPYSRKGHENILKITDKNNNFFTMEIGGNLDMYWIPSDNIQKNNPSNTISFEFKKGDEFFNCLDEIFKKIKLNDDPYSPTLEGDLFTFVSEEGIEEDSNILRIKKNKSNFVVEFIKTDPTFSWSFINAGYSICFCNSGSRHQQIEQIFKLKFLELAYGYTFSELN